MSIALDSINLKDASGNLWLLTIDDSGNLHTAASTGGTGRVVLNDPTTQTTWQFIVSTGGVQSLLQVNFDPTAPTSLQFTSSTGSTVWTLTTNVVTIFGVMSAGIIATLVVPPLPTGPTAELHIKLFSQQFSVRNQLANVVSSRINNPDNASDV